MGKFDPQVIKRLSKLSRARFEVGEPFRIDEGELYMCLAKVVGPKYGDLPALGSLPPPEDDDETLCVLSEEGKTPEEAKARLLERIASARMLPTVPPAGRPRPGWLSRLILVFAKGGSGAR